MDVRRATRCRTRIGRRRGDRPAGFSLARPHHLLAGGGLRRLGRPDRGRGAQVAAFFGDAAALRFRGLGRDRELDRPRRRLGPTADDPALRPSLRRGRRRRRLPDRLEMRGLTQVRSGAATYPAVQALRDLAADCRAILGPATRSATRPTGRNISATIPQDGSGDVFFHLDPLWADADVDFVGIDNYMPLSDWRDGGDHLDALAGWPADLRPRLSASQHRGRRRLRLVLCQRRRPRGAGPHADHRRRRRQALGVPLQGSQELVVEPAFRPPGRVESGSPTAWVPESEADPLHRGSGCPAIDKRHQPAERVLRPEISESFAAVLLARLPRRLRSSAATSRRSCRYWAATTITRPRASLPAG